MHPTLRVATLLLSCPALPALAADMSGSADHPKLPRVSGSEIIGFDHSDYDAGNFITEGEDGKPTVQNAEGVRTRLLYLANAGNSPLKIMRNYETALGDLGDVEEVFACKDKECPAHILTTTLWSKDTMIPTEGVQHPTYLIGFSHNIKTPAYRYAEVAADGSMFHVGVFTAALADNNSNTELRGRTVALVEIVEIADFKPTLEFVDAGEMQSQISESGHVALYGLLFDHDQATLKTESQSTLEEIAKVLRADAGMHVYVVGHTDDVGALEYNQSLSLRRATTVVDALVTAGIDAGRMTPLGAGPVAPVGSNDTEEGRALNRRVELVKRADR